MSKVLQDPFGERVANVPPYPASQVQRGNRGQRAYVKEELCQKAGELLQPMKEKERVSHRPHPSWGANELKTFQRENVADKCNCLQEKSRKELTEKDESCQTRVKQVEGEKKKLEEDDKKMVDEKKDLEKEKNKLEEERT